MSDLYQIGLPVERLSTVFMLWSAYERPEKILVSPAKADDWAVIELRNVPLAASIIQTVEACKVKIVKEPVKTVRL